MRYLCAKCHQYSNHLVEGKLIDKINEKQLCCPKCSTPLVAYKKGSAPWLQGIYLWFFSALGICYCSSLLLSQHNLSISVSWSVQALLMMSAYLLYGRYGVIFTKLDRRQRK